MDGFYRAHSMSDSLHLSRRRFSRFRLSQALQESNKACLQTLSARAAWPSGRIFSQSKVARAEGLITEGHFVLGLVFCFF